MSRTAYVLPEDHGLRVQCIAAFLLRKSPKNPQKMASRRVGVNTSIEKER